MSRAPMIVFSGVDGAGKSTQIELLAAELRAAGSKVTRCWARGGYTPLFSLLKRILRRTPGTRLPAPGNSPERDRAMRRGWVRKIWLTLALLDLMLVYGVWLRWSRLLGRVVICDRYLADTALDFSFNFPGAGVEQSLLWKALCRLAPAPDITFVMLLPVAESMRRCKEKNEPFTDSEQRFRDRLARYERIAQTPGHVVIDAALPIDEIAARIRVSVASLLPAPAGEQRHAD